jgi:hypothetical protein
MTIPAPGGDVRPWIGCLPNQNATQPERNPTRTLPDRTLPDRTLPDRTLPDRTQPDRNATWMATLFRF